MAGNDLKLALRMSADFRQARTELDQLSDALGDVSDSASSTATSLDNIDASAAQAAAAQLRLVGESAEQQEARLRAMVEASLEQRAALDAVAAASQRTGAAVRESAADWQSTAAAQTTAMQAHTNAERAAEQHALAEQRAAEAAKQAAVDFERESKELVELLGRIDPVIRELERLDDLERRLRATRATGRLDLESYDRFNAKLQAQRAALTGQGQAMKLAGISAGQYQQAMRQLPMQITDITTSLASGMPVWMVAIQQGGQIKDSFGGVGNAARAIVSMINPLTIALGAAAVAIGAAALAYKQGSDEATAFNRALILTGNSAGMSADQLAEAARRIDAVAGTHHAAAQALTEVASRGKFTAEQIEQIGRSAELMRVATGKAVADTVSEFERLATDPVDAIVKLNEKHHFLTQAVYAQIAAMERQGDRAGAAKLAMETYSAASDDMARRVNDNLGPIEEVWQKIKKGATEAWDEMLGIGREKTLADLRSELEQIENNRTAAIAAEAARMQRLAGLIPGVGAAAPVFTLGAAAAGVDDREAELRAEIAKREQEQAAAKQAADQQRIQDNAIAAQREIDKLREQSLSNAEKREKAIAEYRLNVEKLRAANPGAISDDQVAKDIAAIEARFKDPAAKAAKRDPRDSTFESLNRQLTERIATLNAAAEAETRLTDAQRFAERVQATLADGTTKLTVVQREQIRLRLQELAAADQAAQRAQDAKQLADVQTQYLRAIGDSQAVAQAAIEKRYGDLLKRLEQRGDHAGIDMVNKLVNVEQAKARIDQLQREIDRVLGEQSRGEQSVQTRLQAGLMTEVDARERIVELSQQSADKLAAIRPQLLELSAMPGDVGAAAAVALQSLDQQVETLRSTMGLLGETVRVSLQDGLAGALERVATGASNLREALQGLLDSVIGALARLSAHALSDKIVTSAAGLFNGGAGDGATDAVSGAASATTTAANTTAVAANTTAVGANATALAAATTATGAFTTALAAAAAAAAGESTTGLVGGAVKAFVGAGAAATGGRITGPGTGTSDSIPVWLSNNEFVTRAAVVSQPGALPFLHDFNRYGMSALDQWAQRVRHATGGLAGVPAPSMPSPRLGSAGLSEPAAGGATTLTNAQNFYLVDDPSRVADMAFGSRQGQDAFVVMLSRDPAKFRQALQL